MEELCHHPVLEHTGRQFQFCSPRELIKVPHPAILKHCGSLSASQKMV